MSEGSRWLLSVALYALAVMLMAPAAYGALGLYFHLWGIPWPSQDWNFARYLVAYIFGGFGFVPFAKARELNR